MLDPTATNNPAELQRMQPVARAIAYYLPQFHPNPDNDRWWGPGFTEWTNVTKAKSLFRGHHQPNLPADLGFYDLRVPETRQQQAELAARYGIEGFCYWHYWFGNGRRILERPFQEVLDSRQPNFPFCLAWANESWLGIHHGIEAKRILIAQEYPGINDYERHFASIEAAFHDDRYIKVVGKPLFVVYRPHQLPDAREFVNCWRKLAERSGLKGLHLAGVAEPGWHAADHGFDAEIPHEPWRSIHRIPKPFLDRTLRRIFGLDVAQLRVDWLSKPRTHRYEDMVKFASFDNSSEQMTYPCVVPNWDTTPRQHKHSIVLRDSEPRHFERLMQKAVDSLHDRDPDNRIIFIKSWNEWAEGNYLEPDQRYGHQYLEIVKRLIISGSSTVATESDRLSECSQSLA
ncbi:MAG TPA: glycoside hydrolase family 99-like domain-containing protein [Trichormus sp.]